MWIPARRYDPEWMDRDDNPAESLERALDDLDWTNRRLGGRRSLLGAVEPLLSPGAELSILDVGTGGADLPRAVVELARRRGADVRIVAVDREPRTVAFAGEKIADLDEVRVLRADAFHLPFEAGSFDLVTASLFLHHFDEVQAALLLQEFARVARRAVIVNDLRRHWVPWAFIQLVSRLTGKDPMYVHDAPLSVLRGFTSDELEQLGACCRGARVSVRRRWPFRLVLTCEVAG